ncbi:MAG: hypothetical protein ACJ780_32215 [Solirubrobacteraceae bacterium]
MNAPGSAGERRGAPGSAGERRGQLALADAQGALTKALAQRLRKATEEAARLTARV